MGIIKTVGVVGSGTMGSGIAQIFAMKGFDVIVNDVHKKHIDEAAKKISWSLDRFLEKKTITEDDKNNIMKRIVFTTEIIKMRECDLIVEAIIEKMDEKNEIFRRLDKICKKECIFASNTSTLSITRLSRSTRRSDKFIGMHFFNPAQVMKPVEIIKGEKTSQDTLQTIKSLCIKLEKIPVEVKDSAGFIGNRILFTLINEAIICYEEKIATKEDIDKIMKLGAGHPMGPLELADFIGLDVCLDVLHVLEKSYGEKFRPPEMLKQLVKKGYLGKKSGKGFYEYNK